jgi:hypothetical protein
MRGVKDVGFSENGFVVKTLHGEQRAQSYRLRHTVFAESLTWVFGNGPTVDRDERTVFAHTVEVQHPRDQLLAGPTLSLNQDCAVVVCNLRDEIQDTPNRFAGAD